MNHFHLFTLFSFLSLAVISGCGIHENKNSPNTGLGTNVQLTPSTPVAFSNIKQDLLLASCVTCHLNGNHRGGIALDTYAEVKANLGDIQSDIADGSMPQTGSLSAYQIALFKQWIAQGSPEFAVAPTTPTATPTELATPSPTLAPSPTGTPLPTGTPVPGTLKISFAQVSSAVFEVSCKKCHLDGAHKGGVALDTYADAKDHLSDIQSEVAEGSMPPDGPMTDAQNALLSQWIAQGAPENAEDAQAPAPTPTPSPTVPPPANSKTKTASEIQAGQMPRKKSGILSVIADELAVIQQ